MLRSRAVRSASPSRARLYLELVAFKPFSEPLDDPERNSVRNEFIERPFVGDPGAEGEDHKGENVR
jgi:hypothetical protein